MSKRINVGDKIKLKELKDCKDMKNCHINKSMHKYFGKTLTVSKIFGDRVTFEEDADKYVYIDDWFDSIFTASDTSTGFKLTKNMEGKKIKLKTLSECYKLSGLSIVSTMEKFFGRVVTISTVCDDGTFTIKEDWIKYYFSEKWIDKEYTAPDVYIGNRIEDAFASTVIKQLEKTSININKVIVNDKCVIILAESKKTGKNLKSIAKCAETDKFDIQKGFEIALTKLLIKNQQLHLKELSK